MKLAGLLPVLAALSGKAAGNPRATNVHGAEVTYQGVYANEVEGFIGIRYAQDTGGNNRFKPPIPYTPAPGSAIQADEPGPACPQPIDTSPPNINQLYSNVTHTSEDCLRLNIWRPNGTTASDKLPVLVFIHGGSFILGSKDGVLSQPGGMIINSVQNGYPVMNVELNYRLGVFGFAQSAALAREGSQNAGVRDQRLALEWVHENIAFFGGDPSSITLHGQSSGGTAVGFQILAYGGSRPVPFHQAVCQSQALDLAITSNITRDSMVRVWENTTCASHLFDSDANIKCLRSISAETLLNSQLETTLPPPMANGGDNWLPVVDGDFVPAAPSTLFAERRFAKNMRTIIGWADNDAVPFTPSNITTPQDTYDFIHGYVAGLTDASLQKLLSLYPSSEFHASHFPNGTIELNAEVYRTARIFRDLIFTCQPILYGQALAAVGNEVYFYDQNETMLTPGLEALGEYGLGVVHTSELSYVFGNISKYDNIPGVPYHPTPEDYRLQTQESNSWSSFASVGRPSLQGHSTLKGWRPADFHDPNFGVFVIGGPTEGYAGKNGKPSVQKIIAAQKLKERCGFLNSPEIVKELQY